jgi:hypothetical protein
LALGAHFFCFFRYYERFQPASEASFSDLRQLQDRVKKHKPWSKYDQQDHEGFDLHAFLCGSTHGRR